MPRLLDLSGQRFGMLTVVSRSENRGLQTAWKCQCDCGGSCVKFGTALKRDPEADCGCVRAEAGRLKADFPGEYKSWQSMRSRCLNPDDEHYGEYGARGITVCERWKPRSSFSLFLADMGPRPSSEHSIDREDNDGPYSPDNCRWANRSEQQRNKRNNVRIEIHGETRTMTEWCALIGRDKSVVSKRLKRGWEPSRAVLSPSRRT